jgi:hypothetical protein
MTSQFHNDRLIDSRLSPVGIEGVPQVMEAEVLYFCPF